MREIEIRAQNFSDHSWEMALSYGAMPWQRDEASRERCECCGKLRGLGYIWFTEDNHTQCLWCETIKLFDKKI